MSEDCKIRPIMFVGAQQAGRLGARVSARRRDVSLQSKSRPGTNPMDTYTTINQTCRKHSVSFYDYIRDRFSRKFAMPSLANLIRIASQRRSPLLC